MFCVRVEGDSLACAQNFRVRVVGDRLCTQNFPCARGGRLACTQLFCLYAWREVLLNGGAIFVHMVGDRLVRKIFRARVGGGRSACAQLFNLYALPSPERVFIRNERVFILISPSFA